MLQITIINSDGTKQQLSFDKQSLIIGRSAGNDIVLDFEGVSRYHARIIQEGSSVVVEDLDSKNGTFVNSQRIKHHELSPGDTITVGSSVLKVVSLSEVNSELPVDQASNLGKVVPLSENNQKSEKPVSSGASSSEAANEDDASMTGGEQFYWESLKNFLAPVWDFIIDDSISEVMVNGPAEIYVERKGSLTKTDRTFTEAQLNAAVLNIAQYVGRRVSEQEPYLDARLPDGSRVAVLLPPCSRKGTSIAIRKFAKEALTMERLLKFGSISQEMITFLKAAVELKKNIIISGGTSSGKTSLLNVVSGLIPANERIITIEDSAELQLMQDHVVPWETKPADKRGRGEVTIRDLVRASLRMRPDRIVVGEIRGGEALDLLQAMNTGHSGSMATTHASSPIQSLSRLETLSLFSGIEIPIRALREQVSMAIDIVIQASRLPDHSRKVTHISEIMDLTEDGKYQANDIFVFKRTGMKDGKIEGSHVWTGYVPSFVGDLDLAGFTEAVRLFAK